jgi:thiol-disulfide isomerase/thioredoxin
MGLTIAVVLLPGIAFSGSPKPVDLPFKDLQGRTVHLRERRGKPVVLNFWATWCVPCNAEMPIFVELEKEYRPRGIDFIAASLDEKESRRKIPEFLSKFDVAFTVWTGASTMDMDDLKLGPALPATAFLDPEGRIVARVLGQITRDELKDRLEWLAGGQKGPAPDALVTHFAGK